jgi:small subunit ribosomal protein S16
MQPAISETTAPALLLVTPAALASSRTRGTARGAESDYGTALLLSEDDSRGRGAPYTGYLTLGRVAPSLVRPVRRYSLGPAGHSPLAGARHSYLTAWEKSTAVAVKIKLKRLGKIREPYYRIVVADARTKRDGRAIEEIGKYHPKLEPSLIQIDSERAQYWLSVGAQPTEPVQHLLTITGDWQKFKGLPGTEGTLRTGEPKADKKDRYEELVKESLAAKEAKAAAKPARSAPKKRGAEEGRAGSRPRRRCRARRGQAAASLSRLSPRPRQPAPPRRAVRPRRPPLRPLSPRPLRPSWPPRPKVLEEALDHLVRGIVGHPDDVRVVSRMLRRGNVLEVRVHPDDLGKVIGRGGPDRPGAADRDRLPGREPARPHRPAGDRRGPVDSGGLCR